MRTISYQTIQKQYEKWHEGYTNNDQRGRENLAFVLASEQWEEQVTGPRATANKESLTFNLCLKHSRRLKAQSREIDLSVNVAPLNTKAGEDIQQLNTYKVLLNSLILSDELTKTFGRSYDQCVEYGYSFLEINYELENDQSLNTIPVVRLYRDPAMGFWDKSATDPNKIKGRFCGIKRCLSKDEFLSKYEKYKKGDHSWLKEKDNEFYDYWYRDYKPAEFKLLMTGSYKREDLITGNDELAIEPPDEDLPLIKTAQVGMIYHSRYCNKEVIQKATLFPTDDLPLVYHPACTVVIPERDDATYPLIHHLKGAQKLHNYINSQIATIAKNSTGDKWIFSAAHVAHADHANYAKGINTSEGGFVFGGDIGQIRRERAGELPASMIQMQEVTRNEISELAGSMQDAQSSEQTVVSGVALDRITHNIGLINVESIAVHIEFINVISKLLRQIIPRIYTEERTLIVKKKDGSGEAIIINELMPLTNDTKNNIKDINNDFHYDITASPSSTMQKENTLKALTNVYALDPQAWQTTGDIYMRNLSTEDAPELERRISVNIDPDLIKYSQGELTLKEFTEAAQQKQQSQTQKQMQMMMSNPQFQMMMKEAAAREMEGQAEQIKAQASTSKAQTAQFDAETKRMKVVGNLQTDGTDQQMKAAKMISDDQRAEEQHTIDEQRLMPLGEEMPIGEEAPEPLTFLPPEE